MKKVPSKRLPLHRETLAQLQGSELKVVAGNSDFTTTHFLGCHNGGPSSESTC